MHDCYVMLTCREKISVADLQKKKKKKLKEKKERKSLKWHKTPHLVIELFHKQTNNTNSSTSRRNQINQSTKLNNRNFNFLTQNIKKNQNFNNHMKKLKTRSTNNIKL